MKNLNLAIGVAALVSAAACGGGGEIRQVGTGAAAGSPATSASGGTAPGGTVAQAGQPGADAVGGISPQGSAQPQGPAAQPQGSAAAPGAVTPTPAASAGPAAAPAGPVTCTNADTSTLPIDETGWVARECNNAGIQGAFYCYDDGVNPSGCTPETAPYIPGSGMCLQGSTTVDPDFKAWGAGIGLSLNDPGEMDPTGAGKGAFDATANGLLGFNIMITGDTGGLPIRVAFTKEAEPADPSPFVQVPGQSTTPYEILIADALVPETWDTCVGDACLADPTSVYDIQIQVVGGEEAADYNFCIESITPITDGSAPAQPAAGGAVAAYGSEQCGDFNTIDIGPYMVQNNAYGNTSHCIQALWDQGSTGGFKLTNVNGNVPAGGAPGSYPSVVYGWHVDGLFHGGGYTSARQLNAIASIPSSGSFTVPGAGRYNMSFDNWIKNAPTSANDQGTLEQMIWLNQRETTPIGSVVDSVDIGGQQWEVWYGPNQGFNTVSYIRATNTTSWNFDLKPFMDDTVQRGYAAAGDYLLGVQAGFEIWEATQSFSVDSFSVSVQ